MSPTVISHHLLSLFITNNVHSLPVSLALFKATVPSLTLPSPTFNAVATPMAESSAPSPLPSTRLQLPVPTSHSTGPCGPRATSDPSSLIWRSVRIRGVTTTCQDRLLSGSRYAPLIYVLLLVEVSDGL
jgi:hypothetical protein